MTDKIVLQKYIAQAGQASRRSAELLIKQERVTINNQTAKLGDRVGKEDEVKINNQKIKLAEEKIYIIVNKPKDYVCTNRKFKGEKNVFELLNNVETRFIASPICASLHIAGRLDKNSHGLVLLTNDGDLTEKLTHPRYGHEKEYFIQLKVKGRKLEVEKIINNFKKGIDIGEGDGMVKAKSVKYLGNNTRLPDGQEFNIILTEGKKRQIRRMFKALDLEVADLGRVRIGNLKLGSLKEGDYKKLNNKEIEKLKNGEMARVVEGVALEKR